MVNDIYAASRLPQSRRLRLVGLHGENRRTSNPPHDCRSRGDCGLYYQTSHLSVGGARLTIAAVAATAARIGRRDIDVVSPASRLPQSRRLRRQI